MVSEDKVMRQQGRGGEDEVLPTSRSRRHGWRSSEVQQAFYQPPAAIPKASLVKGKLEERCIGAGPLKATLDHFHDSGSAETYSQKATDVFYGEKMGDSRLTRASG